MTLLRDLIAIPEQVHHSDFVVSLADGIGDPERTVRNYVVTDQIVHCFDRALGLITSVAADGSSKGAYLHGSFGAGKSHFMAVLSLLLDGNPHARGHPQLGDIVARYDPKLDGRRFLLVPYHMVGASSMEAGVLGGYVEHVRKRHPDAPLPGVYLDGAILEQARTLRTMMGDEAFFANLGGSGEDAAFGALAAGWDAARFEPALAAAPGHPERVALVGDFIDAYSKHTQVMAAAGRGGFVSFDTGLAAISRHAKSLGYDALVLFLDELILWFASRMANPDFVKQEGQKVAKLVEAASSDRPAPLASLIARQRDLREFLGQGVPGADRLNFSDALEFWESRFDTIELADTNLRAIVEKRLLQPKTAAAKSVIDDAFDSLAAGAGTALDTLMTSQADRAAFRRVYPFSPALIEALVAVSSYLQRERTALRLLLELLVRKRDTLTVGDLVPLGDLYDVIRGGEEPFSEDLRRHFARARDMYDNRIRPLLLAEFGVDDEEARALPPGHAFHADDRLIKTLLLAALAPDAAPLKELTLRRLTDLNHGTIRTPIPGAASAAVHGKLRQWQPEIPEMRIEGDEDPRVSLRLLGVDVQAVLDQAQHVDNLGARRRKITDLLVDALELKVEDDSFLPATKTWIWRGSRRTVDVVFANVRDEGEIPDQEFRAPNRARIIIDYPFDEGSHGPADDLVRMETLQGTVEPTPTVAWLPRFMTEEARKNLGRLVVLDHVLAGDRLQGYTTHLSPQDRLEAKHALEHQAEAMRQLLRNVLRQAYGIEAPDDRWVSSDLAPHEQFPTLDPTLSVRPPAAAALGGALEAVLDQVLSHQYPAHPDFEDEVRIGDLRTALKHVERAVSERDHRVEIPQPDRKPARKVLGPLKIATTGEAHMVLTRHWKDHFHTRQAEDAGRKVTVERLRAWMDVPSRMGLDERVGDLVIASYALMDNRVAVLAGSTVPLDIGGLQAQTELRTQELPEEDDWVAARPMAQAVFGVDGSPIRNAANLATLANRVREVAAQHRAACSTLVERLHVAAVRLGAPEDCDRVRTARETRDLVEALGSADEVEVIELLARLQPPTNAQAMGRSMKNADAVADALDRAQWPLITEAAKLPGEWGVQGKALLQRVSGALSHDELAEALPGVLLHESRVAAELLAEAARKAGEAARPAPRPQPAPGETLEATGSRSGLSGPDAKPILDELSRRSDELEHVDVTWRFRD